MCHSLPLLAPQEAHQGAPWHPRHPRPRTLCSSYRIMTVHPRTISRSDAQGSDTATSQHGPTQGSHEPRRRCRHRSGSPHRPVPGSRRRSTTAAACFDPRSGKHASSAADPTSAALTDSRSALKGLSDDQPSVSPEPVQRPLTASGRHPRSDSHAIRAPALRWTVCCSLRATRKNRRIGWFVLCTW